MEVHYNALLAEILKWYNEKYTQPVWTNTIFNPILGVKIAVLIIMEFVMEVHWWHGAVPWPCVWLCLPTWQQHNCICIFVCVCICICILSFSVFVVLHFLLYEIALAWLYIDRPNLVSWRLPCICRIDRMYLYYQGSLLYGKVSRLWTLSMLSVCS